MKERLRLLMLALGALALFYTFMFPKPPPDLGTQALPLSTENGPAGYQALWRWLHEQRIPAVSLRHDYGQLAALLPKPTGNVLIVTLPQHAPADGPDIDDLRTWEEDGNTLLVLAAIEDTPLWSLGADPLLDSHLARLTGLRFERPKGAPRIDLEHATENQFDVRPRGPHPLMVGVGHLTALTPLPARRAVLDPKTDVLPLELATRADTGDTVLWLTRLIDGQVIVSTAASLFSNGAVSRADNARLMANILAWSLAPGGSVVFDDSHQGLTDEYDARAFFADPRLHHTLLWIVLLWLALILGTQPLRAIRSRWQPPDETLYVDASARYFAAVVPPAAAAQRLIEGFLKRLAPDGASGITNGFERLEANANVPRQQIAALRDLYARARAGRRIDLTRLQNLLSHLRRIIE